MNRSMRAFFVVGLMAVAVLSACGKAPCSASSCATGCCDASGTCQAGNTSNACGIGGKTCSSCLLTQSCSQGACFGGMGGGSGGGSGGGNNNGLVVFPATANVPEGGSLTLSAALPGSAPSPAVSFVLETSGNGSLSQVGTNAAVFYASPGNTTQTIRVRATADYMTSISQLIELSIVDALPATDVMPRTYSSQPYLLDLNSQQTFALMRARSGGATGVRTVQWHRWPQGETTTHTITATADLQRVYARDVDNNIFYSAEVAGSNVANGASVTVTPALSTVAPNAVVQLTAIASDGATIEWQVGSLGTVSASGTFTAPPTPGIYLVLASATGLPVSLDDRYAIATIIVQ